MILIDPPSGWRYGFPKVCKSSKNQSLKDWLIENGYPEYMCTKLNLDHCRYMGEVDEIRQHLLDRQSSESEDS